MRLAFRIVLVTLAVIGVSVGGLYAYDKSTRFWSWRSLSKGELVEEAVAYTEFYRVRDVGICVYVLDCSSGRARLHRVADLDGWDLDRTLELIWERRFSDFCPGRTANIGLHLVSLSEGNQTLQSYNETARWSFGLDRFVSRQSRFQSGSFSEEPWERCAEPFFIATVPGG